MRPNLAFWKGNGRAHCGTNIEGGYLYTLTLTDMATGWTECLPLLYRSQETVLAAIRRARTLFTFSILGIDTDNGGEFISEVLIAYCEQEHITFTRGRPHLKNDQCNALRYDPEKTPLQRLLLSEILPGSEPSRTERNGPGP